MSRKHQIDIIGAFDKSGINERLKKFYLRPGVKTQFGFLYVHLNERLYGCEFNGWVELGELVGIV